MPRRWTRVLVFLMLIAALVAPAGAASKKKAAKKTKPVAAATASPAKPAPAPKTVEEVLNSPDLSGAKVGVYVVSLADGHTAYQHNIDLPLIPASTNKIVTGAAAYGTLGPRYQYPTEIYTDGRVTSDGTVNGNLYIKGYGDPGIAIEEAWLIAHRIRGFGVKKVTGQLIGDASYFSPETVYDKSVWNYPSPMSYTTPMSALSFNFNTVQAHVIAGPAEGAPAIAQLDPPNGYYQIDNQATTCAKCKPVLNMRLEGHRAIITGQARSGMEPWTGFLPVAEPADFAVESIKSLLAAEGVTVAGNAVAGTVPDSARLLFRHEGRELSLMVRFLFRFSNNYTAEQLFKTMGARASGAPGTREAGCAAVEAFLRDNSLWREGVVIADGSGLSKLNRQTPSSLVAILTWAANHPEVYPEYLEAMSIAGVDGTLARRFRNTPLEGRVRAKTGYVGGVITLAGYAWSTRGEPFAFAVMVNNPPPSTSVGNVKKAIDTILLMLLT